MQMTDEQLKLITTKLSTIKDCSPFYAEKFKDIDLADVRTQEDFEKLPFSEKDDLRRVYPLGLQAVPDEEVVRIHSSSGTTGTPVIIPYTAQDVTDWAIQFERCYRTAGITNLDRIQITPGYGLWTAGIGFQLGCERLGAMAIPMGPGNTEKQLKMMQDLHSTVITGTSSYALLLAEEISTRGLRDKLDLKKGVIGSERWGEKMRHRIANELGIEIFDIYGLTEIYGPGIGISCEAHHGMHVWEDFVYVEIVDPKTGEVLPDGEVGEIVLTTLRKQGAPLIRYRTHDLTRVVKEKCACGRTTARMQKVRSRCDDMLIIRGTNVFPSQVEDVLSTIEGVTPHYRIVVDNETGLDRMVVHVELKPEAFSDSFEEMDAFRRMIEEKLKSVMLVASKVKLVEPGGIERSIGKTKHVQDLRK
mgnify:CR=1 FL=1